jgi:hypothetical protein
MKIDNQNCVKFVESAFYILLVLFSVSEERGGLVKDESS